MMKIKNFVTEENLAKINLMQINLEKMELQKMKFQKQEINLLNLYCKKLNYHLSFNKQFKTAKIFNLRTHKYGYIQKINNSFWYGYIKKINNDSKFIKKYIFDDNLFIFKLLNNINKKDNHNTLIKTTCGIIELES